MNLDNIKEIKIPEGKVKEIKLEGVSIWTKPEPEPTPEPDTPTE